MDRWIFDQLFAIVASNFDHFYLIED